MIKQEILNYVSTSPQNTNPAVLSTMLDSFAEAIGGSGSGGGSVMGIPQIKFDLEIQVGTSSSGMLSDHDSAILSEMYEKNLAFAATITLHDAVWCEEGLSAAFMLTASWLNDGTTIAYTGNNKMLGFFTFGFNSEANVWAYSYTPNT